jgi:predicted exporter
MMKAYEYVGKVLSDGHLSLPENLKDKLKTDLNTRVMLLVEDEDSAWNRLVTSQFLKGYSEADALYDDL